MHVHRHALDERARNERARHREQADEQRERQHLGVDHAGDREAPLAEAASSTPVASGAAGALYLWSALALGAVFLGLAAMLAREPGLRWARATFHYSLLYLALIFVALVIDAA